MNVRNKILLGISLSIVLNSSYAITKYSPTCPKEITVNQQLASPIPNWRVFIENPKNNYGMVAIRMFVDEPEKRADLIPETSHYSSTWKFNKNDKAYIVCMYGDTSLKLTQPLKDHTTQCTVSYHTNATTRWGQVPKRIECQ